MQWFVHSLIPYSGINSFRRSFKHQGTYFLSGIAHISRARFYFTSLLSPSSCQPASPAFLSSFSHLLLIPPTWPEEVIQFLVQQLSQSPSHFNHVSLSCKFSTEFSQPLTICPVSSLFSSTYFVPVLHLIFSVSNHLLQFDRICFILS